jgi:hypothetical protein
MKQMRISVGISYGFGQQHRNKKFFLGKFAAAQQPNCFKFDY